MAAEKTFVLLKPDCMQRGLTGEIISRIEKKGFRIANIRMMKIDQALLLRHYHHIVDKPYFTRTVEYMTSGPVIAIIVEGENAIHGMRLLIGAAAGGEPAPGSIRGDFAVSETINIIHASDSPQTAAAEIDYFFGTGS